MYKKAARLKLRFQTSRGLLSVEDLFGLSLKSLEEECRKQFKSMKESNSGASEELDFLGESKVDPEEELKFEILKDIYKTKKAEIDEQKKSVEIKAEKQKILEILKEKQDQSLRGMSEEELKKKLEELG